MNAPKYLAKTIILQCILQFVIFCSCATSASIYIDLFELGMTKEDVSSVLVKNGYQKFGDADYTVFADSLNDNERGWWRAIGFETYKSDPVQQNSNKDEYLPTWTFTFLKGQLCQVSVKLLQYLPMGRENYSFFEVVAKRYKGKFYNPRLKKYYNSVAEFDQTFSKDHMRFVGSHGKYEVLALENNKIFYCEKHFSRKYQAMLIYFKYIAYLEKQRSEEGALNKMF